MLPDKVIEGIKRDNRWPIWLLLVVLFTAMVFIWFILFGGLISNNLGRLEELEDKIGGPGFTEVAQKGVDGITGATPRVIAWTEAIAKELRKSVVGIFVSRTAQAPPWQQGWRNYTPSANSSVGSGVIIHPQGYIITNYHVVSIKGNITISVFGSNSSRDYKGQIVRTNKERDLALLKIVSNESFSPMPIGDSDKLNIGDRVIGIGNPFGLTQTVTMGIISARRRRLVIGNQVMYDLLQTDVPINPGNSGGALCNLKGELIGINNAIYSQLDSVYSGVSFAIPINHAKDLYGSYMDLSVKPARYRFIQNYYRYAALQGPNQAMIATNTEGIEEIAWLGIDINRASPSQRGVLVDEIEGLSPMEAGLRAGDIIRAVNGHQTPDIYSFKEVIKKIPLHVGQGVVLDVYRPRYDQNLFVCFRLKEWDLKGR